jgi:AcrR family transcriptional regulator
MRQRQQNSTESTAVLAPQQAEVITALVRGATVTDATKQANIDRTTFYLRLKSDATFLAELNRAKKEHTDAMRAQLRDLADTAVSTVREMLTGPDVPAGVRLKAALVVLESIGTLKPEPIGKVDPRQIESDLFLMDR